MDKEIRYKGISLTPDPVAQTEGALSVAANAEIHNGAVRPFELAGTDTAALKIGNDVAKLIYVHITTSYTHLLATVGNNLYWFNADGTLGGGTGSAGGTATTALITNSLSNIKDIESIGNTLVVTDDSGLHYILFKIEDGNYKYLGQQPPFLELQFGLTSYLVPDADYSQEEILKFDGNKDFKWNYDHWEIPEDIQTIVTEKVLSIHNKHISELTDENLFTAPFLIRYCYRLYDEKRSMVMHSAPVAMYTTLYHTAIAINPIPTNYISGEQIGGYNKQTHTRYWTSEDTITLNKMALRTFCKPAYLVYKCVNPNVVTQLQEWRDIVKSVDIFITPQQQNVDTSKQIDKLTARLADDNPGVYGGTYYANSQSEADQCASIVVGADENYRAYFGPNLPEYEREAYLSKLRNLSEFFKLHSFPIDDLGGMDGHDRHVPFEAAVLKNITVQEQMKDDYKTHNIIKADNLFSYNQRINASGLAEHLFGGFHPYVLTPAVDSDTIQGYSRISDIHIILQTDEQYHIVKWYGPASNLPRTWLYFFEKGYFFYPDARARYVVVQVDTGLEFEAKVYKLYPHNSLNGAYRFYNNDQAVWTHNDFLSDSELYTLLAQDLGVTFVDQPWSPMPNKIYTSEVKNPYYFPLNAINTVGTGTILGMASTTRALSQGQFGKFPLMAFATDGIWALEVSSTGTYSNIHTISREVVSNPKSICPIDQQVIFASARGLNVVTEQDATSISDVLNGAPEVFGTTIPTLLTYIGTQSLFGHEALSALLQYTDNPIHVFQTADVIYDFSSARLIIIKPTANSQQPVIVYSINDQAYTTAALPPVLTAVNAYPHPYVQFADGVVRCVDQPYPYSATNPDAIPMLLVTRPMSFGDAMYNITDYAHNMQGMSPVIIFFGSNDMVSWHYIGRTSKPKAYYLPVRSYKYLRYALYMQLKPNEQYISTQLSISAKFPKL